MAGDSEDGTEWTQFSGGEGSYRAAKLNRLARPNARHRLLFADVLLEDADTYRFLIEAAHDVFDRRAPNWLPRADEFPDYRVSGGFDIADYAGNPDWRAFLAELRERTMAALPELVWLVEGRDPWEVYRDERYVGNSRIDPCSKILKRQFMDRWRKENCNPATDRFAIGIGDHEAHRLYGRDGKPGLKNRMAAEGWDFHAPLLDEALCYAYPSIAFGPLSIERPSLYSFHYKHGNCGGFCCKAGLAHYQNRYQRQPERYAYDAMMERKLIAFLNNEDAAMLRDRRGGVTRPLSLDAFAERMRRQPNKVYRMKRGESGCGCALDDAA